jgi:hypothetical protein
MPGGGSASQQCKAGHHRPAWQLQAHLQRALLPKPPLRCDTHTHTHLSPEGRLVCVPIAEWRGAAAIRADWGAGWARGGGCQAHGCQRSCHLVSWAMVAQQRWLWGVVGACRAAR